MNSMRNLIGIILAFALAAFAVPSFAQKTFLIDSGFGAFSTFTPGQVIGTDTDSPAPTVGRVVVKNNSPTGNANFNSWRVFAPSGFKILGAKKPSDEPRAGNVSAPGIWAGSSTDTRNGRSYVNITSIAPSVNQLATFALNLKVQAGCSVVTGAQWLIEVYTGGDLKGQMFTLTAGDWPTSSITSGSGCSVQFVTDRAPTGAQLISGSATVTSETNKPAGLGVQAQVMLGTSVDTSYNGPVTIVMDSAPANASIGGATVNAVNGVALFGNSSSTTPLRLDKIGAYSLRPTAGSLTGDAKAILVSDSILDCAPATGTVPASATFNASAGGADDPTDTAYAFGYRGPNWKNLAECTKANYIATNNINNSVEAYDANGFKLPSNAFSIVYDVPPDNQVALAYTLTFQPELSGTDGQPDPAKKVKYCIAGNPIDSTYKDCTFAGNLVDLQGCESPVVALDSIPGTQPACLAGLAWSTVANSSYCTATATKSCVQVTIRVIDARDPPIIR